MSDPSGRKATVCVHAGEDAEREVPGITTPIETATSFPFPNERGEIYYPRMYNTVNQRAVAEKLASLEGGEAAMVFGSGMAAISTALLSVLRSGDHVVLHGALYGGTHALAEGLLPRMGIECSLVASTDAQAIAAAVRPETRVLYFETPTNPLLNILDIRALATVARERGLVSMIDNTFATPINQTPIELGIDVVLHSATKYLNGHSDVNCGALVTSERLMPDVREAAIELGGTLDARACYLLERGLKTLELRVTRQNDNAQRLAEYLAGHPKVRAVHYPGLSSHPGHPVAREQMTGFGGMLAFELDADAATAKACLQRLRLAKQAVSLGGVETLVTFPAETSHASMSPEARREAGVSDTLVRVSVGIEAVDDLIEDFDRALQF